MLPVVVPHVTKRCRSSLNACQVTPVLWALWSVAALPVGLCASFLLSTVLVQPAVLCPREEMRQFSVSVTLNTTWVADRVEAHLHKPGGEQDG